MSSGLIVFCSVHARSSGDKTILLLMHPTINPDFPTKRLSAAYAPSLEAKTVSFDEGVPPLCIYPSTVMRASYPPVS